MCFNTWNLLNWIFTFMALMAYFQLYDSQKYIFDAPYKILGRWTYHSTILILGVQIPFSDWFTFLIFKSVFFLLCTKFPVDEYTARPYWFWSPNVVFGLWGLILDFSTPEIIRFLLLYQISDRLIGHMTYFIFEPLSAQPRIPNFSI
jgi:hypothetical protein